MKNEMIKQLVVNAMYIALLVVSSFICIPIGTVPYTLQTLVVFTILLTVSLKNSLIIFFIYLIMGLIGLPVFAMFSSGLTPTTGFVLGFIVSVPIFHLFKNIIKFRKPNINKFIICLICLLIINIVGCIYYMIYFSCDIWSAIILSVIPYIFIDIFKIIIAIILSNRLEIIISKEKI